VSRHPRGRKLREVNQFAKAMDTCCGVVFTRVRIISADWLRGGGVGVAWFWLSRVRLRACAGRFDRFDVWCGWAGWLCL
jgi:hypothetical protein